MTRCERSSLSGALATGSRRSQPRRIIVRISSTEASYIFDMWPNEVRARMKTGPRPVTYYRLRTIGLDWIKSTTLASRIKTSLICSDGCEETPLTVWKKEKKTLPCRVTVQDG